MSGDNFNFIFISEILHLPIFNATTGKKIGRIVDLAARTSHVYPKITALIASIQDRQEPLYIPWNLVRLTVFKKHVTVEYPFESNSKESIENEILLKKTFLDKQIISTSGYKLVRVNDLQLLIDNSSKDNPNLWLVHIDIGVKGLLRRLGWVNFLNPVFHWLFARVNINDKFLTWKNVQPTTATNVHGSVILKADSSKLSAIHPADLADILEDLGTDERISLLESISPSTAAATLQEMPMNLRVQMAEALENEKLASIISEMQMDETVDLLDELDKERRESLFSLLTQERVTEIQDLTKLSAVGVGSIMNTNFITAKETQTVREVLKLVKAEAKQAELLYYVYIIDDEERLKGVVTLRQLLSTKGTVPVSGIMRGNIVSVRLDSSIKRMSQQFFKYKFEAIPVVDENDKLQGIITMGDMMEAVFPEYDRHRKDSMGFVQRLRERPMFRNMLIFLSVIGPGIITGSVDNDAGGITTYSVAGANYGYKLLWTLLPSFIALLTVQEMNARMGIVTGKGLADLIRENFGVRITFYLFALLLFADIGNTATEFAGVAGSMVIFNVDKYISVPLAAIAVWILVVKGNYKISEKIFLLFSVFLLSYIVSAILAKPDWGQIGKEMIAPSIQWDSAYLITVLGLIGTTVAPWMQFYMQSSVIEKGISIDDYKYTIWDVVVGCVITVVVAFFIIVSCGATLHVNGVQINEAKDAAMSLKPFAGAFASQVFAFGLFVASVFSAAILPLATAFFICEAFGFEAGIDKKFSEAPQFYTLFTFTILIAVGIILLPNAPLIAITIWTQVLNAVLLPVVLICMMIIINKPEIMGEYTNKRYQNIIGWTTSIVLMLLSTVLVISGLS